MQTRIDLYTIHIASQPILKRVVLKNVYRHYEIFIMKISHTHQKDNNHDIPYLIGTVLFKKRSDLSLLFRVTQTTYFFVCDDANISLL